MEKHPSPRPSSKKTQSANDDSFSISSLKIGRPSPAPDKPSREDVSLCINIWATLYATDDDHGEPGELQLPSLPWMRHNPGRQKRFD